MTERLIEQDTRFWEVYNEHGESMGLFMYWDLIRTYCHGYGILEGALNWLRSINHTWKVVGDIKPLEMDSDNPIIQRKKIQYRTRENKRNKKRAKKRGFKLESQIRFGKHSGKRIRDLIDNHPSYWNWVLSKNILLLHPETISYSKMKTQ
jgi:hypothetical protein